MKVKVTWKAFGEKPEQGRFITSVDFELFDFTPSHDALLNTIYKATNLQDELAEFGHGSFSIYIWNVIKARLSNQRTHTSLSVGDEVEIDGITYVCADIGWVVANKADVKYLPSEYGDGAIFSVRAKD